MDRRRRTEYSDFAIRIEADGRGGFRSEVVLAPRSAGARAEFLPPFDRDELAPLLHHLEWAVRGSGRGDRARHLEPPPAAAHPRFDPEEVGTRLFEALFRDDVGLAFELSRPRRDEPGLRIRLLIDPHREHCAEVAALPWELLYDPTQGFLGHSTRYSLVRFLETNQAFQPQPIEGDLRVLLAISSPKDLAPLHGAVEQAAIRQWTALRGVDVDVVEPATLKKVRQHLKQRDYHLFHFCGHGEFLGSRGALVFENDQRGADVVDARLVSAALAEAPALRLAVLNACDSGRMPRQNGRDPFVGVAAALVRSAVPAVIGMQYPVSEAAATRFAEALYTSLATGEPVDTAVAEGRLAILGGDSSTLEWATPALHLRVQNGRLFERQRAGVWRSRILRAGVGLAILSIAVFLGLTADRPPRAHSGSKPPYVRPEPVADDPRCPAPVLLPDLELIYIPPDTLELPPANGEPARVLELETGLCVSPYETTWRQWQTVMGGDAVPDVEHAEDRPAGVSWDDSQRFLGTINASENGSPFRLPTGEEWEYAARARSTTPYSFGEQAEDLPIYGNCESKGVLDDNYDDEPAPVGSFAPNAFGLYDVHGNVAEWVSDLPGAEHKGDRIHFGGSYVNIGRKCTSSSWSPVKPDRRYERTGFRIVRDPVGPGS